MTSVRFEADSLLEYAESQIVGVEYERSLREPPWDGKDLLEPQIDHHQCTFVQNKSARFVS